MAAGMLERERPARMSEEAICDMMLGAGSVAIRDVDAGEEAFLYSSGNYGPGYVMVKGLVSLDEVFDPLTEQLALKLDDDGVEFDNVAGNATGGMIPAHQCRRDYQRITGKKVGFVYVRGTRKEGGHKELVTGLEHIPPTRPDGSPPHWLVVEELVNYAETTTNSLRIFEGMGHVAREGATILHYDHEESNRRLAEAGVRLTYLATLRNLLQVGINNGHLREEAVAKYLEFLKDTKAWQLAHGFTPV